MKKIDKLILGSFLGPFFLTFLVVIFILLSQFMLKYLDEIVGKDLGTGVIVQLIFYFSIFMTPNAFPLAVLLSSLMTFGNLGEHFELTAMKSSGISLIRVMVPIFAFSLLLTVAAYYSNNYIVPKANLKAFSLLYDVKQMKPSMDLKEGSFYNGIEGYSIKVGKKYPDGKSLKDLIIYDHSAKKGNKDIILADSGRMYNILNDRYLVLELYNGQSVHEEENSSRRYAAQLQPDPLVRNYFDSQKIVFSLASFDMKRTKEDLFSSNRLMKTSQQLRVDVDSMKTEYQDKVEEVKERSFMFFDYHLQDIVSVFKQRAREREEKQRAEEEEKERIENERAELLRKQEKERLQEKEITLEKSYDSSVVIKEKPVPVASNTLKEKLDKPLKSKAIPKGVNSKSVLKNDLNLKRKHEFDKQKESLAKAETQEDDSVIVKPTFEENMVVIDSLMHTKETIKAAYSKSLTHVRYVKNNMMMRNTQLKTLFTETNKFELERYKKLSYAITILIMFFIGAPLGAIIKRGGLGLPVLISLSFFILFYVLSMMCEKWTRSDVMDPLLAAWVANIILFPIGIFFMKQAKNDARLFEMDFYNVVFLKIKTQFHILKVKFKPSN